MSMSNYLESALINHVYGGSAYTAAGTVYAALFTSDPTDAGSGTEVSGGSYAREAITWGAESGGSISNSGAITFTQATASWGTITHVGIFDASTAGNLLDYGALDSSVVINNGDTFEFPTGNLTVTYD